MIYDVNKLGAGIVPLGRQGEKLANTIEIDVQAWLDAWPGADISVIVLRPGDVAAYTAKNTSVKDGVLSWVVTDIETAYAGVGTFEIRATAGDVLKKSVVASFEVCKCIMCADEGSEPPEPAKPWLEQATEAAETATKSAEEAQAAAAEALEMLDNAFFNRDGLPDGTDFDTITDNGMYYAYSSRTYPNSPGKYMGVLTVFRRSDGAVVQDFVNASSGNRYARYNVNGWTAWQQGTAMHNRKALAKDADFNTIVEDGIYYAQTPHEQTNRPESGAGLLTVTTQNSVVTQDWVNIMTGTRYARYAINDEWKTWKQGNAAKDRNAVYYAFGDSTTYGQIATTGGQSPYNYPACVGRLLDMKVKNKAVGGQGLLKDWDTIHTNYIDGLDMSDAKLVTVGWAYNDGQSRYETIEIGTAKDTTPDTYTGKYYTIMKEFQEKCPQAQIVLITGYGMTGTTYSQFKSGYNFADGKFYSMKQMYDLLEEMCNINGWCCINQARGTWITKHNWTTYIGDSVHPTADGYIRYGNFMAAKIAGIYANLAAW